MAHIGRPLRDPRRTEQRCPSCGCTLPLSAFGTRARRGRIEVATHCRECERKRNRSRYLLPEPTCSAVRPCGREDCSRCYCRAWGLKRRTDPSMHQRHLAVKRRGRLQSRFGMTEDDYEALLRAQAGTCAVCRRPETAPDRRADRTKALAVDHDHATGEVRGLLCGRCNNAIGLMRDDPALLSRAAEYLNRADREVVT